MSSRALPQWSSSSTRWTFAVSKLVVVAAWVACCASAASDDQRSGDIWSIFPTAVQGIILVFLLGLSAIFCGLTIGVMGLDTLSLEIIADAGSEPDRSFAQELLPMRRLGHQSLSTLILGNMMANVLVAQLVADLTPEGGSSGVVSFVGATLIILIFAEVIPMSICKSPKALQIAASGVPIMRVFILLLYPLAKPLGMFLDLITPHDAGQIYDRNELKKLMRLHCEKHGDRSGLDHTELRLLIGAMEFHEKLVGDIMTPLDRVFMLSDDTPVTRSLAQKLWKEGKSRVPIFHGDVKVITGLLFVKDLVSLLAFRSAHAHEESTENLGMTVGQLLNSNTRDLVCVRDNMTLPTVLRLFQSGAPHLLLVEGHISSDNHDKTFVGVVSLEDVIEELIKGEIRDEYDDEEPSSEDEVEVWRHVAEHSVDEACGDPSPAVGSNLVSKTVVVPRPPARFPRINFNSYYVTGSPLSDDHKWVLAEYLQSTYAAFLSWKLSHIKVLLDEVGDREVVVNDDDMLLDAGRDGSLLFEASQQFSARQPPSSYVQRGSEGHKTLVSQTRPELLLYTYDSYSTQFTLVLHGGVRMVVGEDLFSSEIRSFCSIGDSALDAATTRVPFRPDFTAFVSRTSRLLVIGQRDYERVGAYFRRGSPSAAATNASFARAPRSAKREANNSFGPPSMTKEDMRRHYSEEDISLH